MYYKLYYEIIKEINIFIYSYGRVFCCTHDSDTQFKNDRDFYAGMTLPLTNDNYNKEVDEVVSDNDNT